MTLQKKLVEKPKRQPIMRNVLIIQWKDYLGRNGTPCPKPQTEFFKWIKSEEKARGVVNRRVKSNILWAKWNDIFLIAPPKEMVAEAAINIKETKDVATVTPAMNRNFLNNFLKAVNPKRLFSRQKH